MRHHPILHRLSFLSFIYHLFFIAIALILSARLGKPCGVVNLGGGLIIAIIFSLCFFISNAIISSLPAYRLSVLLLALQIFSLSYSNNRDLKSIPERHS